MKKLWQLLTNLFRPGSASPKAAPSQAEQRDPAAAMRELRTQMLSAPPAELGIEPSADCPEVYGVLMEFPISSETGTVVAMCDGNASLYTTSTFGVMGGGAHASVRAAASEFVKTVASFEDVGELTNDFPYPLPGRGQFYVLTFSGVRQLEDDFAAIESGQSKLSGLFAAGQDVLTQLRLISQGS